MRRAHPGSDAAFENSPDPQSAGPASRPPMIPWLIVGLAFMAPVAFALATGQAWEDFFI